MPEGIVAFDERSAEMQGRVLAAGLTSFSSPPKRRGNGEFKGLLARLTPEYNMV